MLTTLLAPRKSRTAKPLVEEIGMFIAIGTKKKRKKERKAEYLECCMFSGEKGYSK